MEVSRGLLRDTAVGPARGLLGVRGPVEGRPRELASVPAGDTATGLARWLLRGPVRRLVSGLLCETGPGQGSSTLRGPVRGLTMGAATGLGCGLLSMSARGASATIPTSSRTGSFAAAGAGGRKTPGDTEEALRPQAGPRGRAPAPRCRLPPEELAESGPHRLGEPDRDPSASPGICPLREPCPSWDSFSTTAAAPTAGTFHRHRPLRSTHADPSASWWGGRGPPLLLPS